VGGPVKGAFDVPGGGGIIVWGIIVWGGELATLIPGGNIVWGGELAILIVGGRGPVVNCCGPQQPVGPVLGGSSIPVCPNIGAPKLGLAPGFELNGLLMLLTISVAAIFGV